MDYNILFKSLKEGAHTIEFKLDDAFFDLFEESEVQKGNLNVIVNITKRTRGLEMDFSFTGEVSVECDRCLEEFLYPVESTNKIFFEYNSESREVTDELVYISEGEDQLDLSVYMYEFILLSLPLQKFHGDDKDGNSLCNVEMLEELEKLNINNDEIEDPRWDQLRGLIN